MNINMKNLKSKRKGFALIEVIIALTVFLVAISVPLGVTTKALDEESLSRSKIIGTYFAQGGLESVREKRDNNLLTAGRSATFRVDWLEGLSECIVKNIDVSDKSGCDISTSGVVKNCNASIGCSPHRIEQKTGEVLEFIRVIKIKKDVVTGRADVKVIVSWIDNNRDREASIQESIYKYLPF